MKIISKMKKEERGDILYSKLKGLMMENNFTQNQMAKILGISVSTFNQKINGKSDFTIQEAKKIALLFKKEVDVIFR